MHQARPPTRRPRGATARSAREDALLAHLGLYLSLLEDGIPDAATPAQRRSLERARRSLPAALHLIGDLLDVARVESGAIEVAHRGARPPGCFLHASHATATSRVAAQRFVPMPIVLLTTALLTNAPLGVAPDTAFAPPADTTAAVAAAPTPAPTTVRIAPSAPDTVRRHRAVEYSDAYATRLTIHRIGSYAMLPLFAGEYVLGNRLLSPNPQPGWVKGAHVGTAFGLGALFTVNTVTGLWNLYDSRHDDSDRTRKYLHSALLLASDAGFAYTGAIAGNAHNSAVGRTRHKNAALVSMGVSTIGTAMMWLWRK